MGRIMVALNMGNADNRQRLMDGANGRENINEILTHWTNETGILFKVCWITLTLLASIAAKKSVSQAPNLKGRSVNDKNSVW